MSTEQDEAGVYHIDGPPYRGFAIESKGQRVEVIYHTLRYIGSRQECQEAYHQLLQMIRAEVKKLSEEIGNGLLTPIIWWRRRVSFEKDIEDPSRWSFYCRLATTPELPVEFWQKWETPEGAISKNAREVA